jgi:hypothetical protein
MLCICPPRFVAGYQKYLPQTPFGEALRYFRPLFKRANTAIFLFWWRSVYSMGVGIERTDAH